MLSKSPKHRPEQVTVEECVGDLAVALGMWIGSPGMVSEMQVGCFIYSTLKLAFSCGVEKEKAIQPLDILLCLIIQKVILMLV